MPPPLTYAARVSDGLPLVASYAPAMMASSAGSSASNEHKEQAKMILRGLSSSGSAAKCSIETSNRKVFHYLLRENMCFLTLCEASYPKRLAFLYLEEIGDGFVQELTKEYGDRWRSAVDTAARPYQFIKFDPYIQKKQREFVDPTSRQNATKLNEDLNDIHSIMKKNIEEVLNRGEKLENVSAISSRLVDQSKEFKWGAKKLTWQAMLNKYGPMVAAGAFVIFVLYIKFFW